MFLRAAVSACLMVVVCASCRSSSSSAPALSISPGGTVQVSRAQVFSAVALNSTEPVTWTLSGPGSLSNSVGYQTSYVAPSSSAPSPGTGILTATVAGVSQTVNLEISPPALAPQVVPGLSAAVTVEYDAQGIPHVFCAAMFDCLSVQGFLHARDRLFQMDFLRRTARGRLAMLLGSLGVSQDEQILTVFTTREGKRIEDVLTEAADPQTQAAMQAYVRGVNAYLSVLRAHPELLPGEYAQLPMPLISGAEIPDWTVQDTFALARLQQYQLSQTLSQESAYGQFAQAYLLSPLADPGKVNAWLRSREPVHSYTVDPIAAREPRPGRSPKGQLARAEPGVGAMLAKVHAQATALQKTLGALGIGVGSNNWVVDAAHSATGSAMVANDPHLQLAYPPLFHLAGMTASDGSGLELTGGAFPGIPGALVGRGKHVGWGVTVVGYDVTDLYLETLTVDAEGAPAVRFKGAPVTLRPVHSTIEVRGGSPVSFTTFVVPHHGPIIQLDQANHTAISVRWTGHEATNDLRGFLGLNVATSVGQAGDDPEGSTAFAALTHYATGAQNFVLADDQGNIGYDPHALVPRRPWAGSASSGRPLLPWLPLPGDGSAEWGTGLATDDCAGAHPAAACWVSDADLPWGVNPAFGFFATANSDPIGDTADNNPIVNPRRAGPSYLSFDWDDPTGLRVKRIADLIQAAITTHGKISLDDMIAIQSDHQSSTAKLLMPALRAVPDAARSETFKAAMALLEQWSQDGFDCPTGLTGGSPSSPVVTDATALRDANACLLFHSFFRTALTNIFADDLAASGLGRDQGAEVRALFYMLEPATPPGDTTFCDDVDAKGQRQATHTCIDQLVRALGATWSFLGGAYGDSSKWVWGRVHTATAVSLAAPLISAPFEAGPFARPGGFETVDVGNPNNGSDPRSFSYGSGSNVRHISVMDPAAPVIKMQLPGPERDVPWNEVAATAHDLLNGYAANRYFDFTHGRQIETQGSVVSTQLFNPQ